MSIANIISFIPVLFFSTEFFVIMNKILRKQEFKENIKYFYGLIVSTFSAQAFKYLIPYPTWFHNYCMRPIGACGCDYLSQGGVVVNKPGMPSGHMATTSYFVCYNILYILKNNYNKLLIIPNIILLILMGWARIIKKCHNLIQVICGIILGSLLGVLFFIF